MIYSTRITNATTDTIVYTSSTTGAAVAGLVESVDTAITNIILCNTGTPDPTDENVNTASVTIYLLNADVSLTPSVSNTIVSNLIVPAGETIFFSDERIVLRGTSIDARGSDKVVVRASAANLITVTVSALIV
jgi:hypothetical protein